MFRPQTDPGEHKAEKNKLPRIDTIIALHEVSEAYNTAFVSCYVSTELFFNNYDWSDGAVTELAIMMGTSSLALVCFACYIFVSWKTGPAWWKKIGYYVYLGFAITAYIVVPVVNIILFAIFIAAFGAASIQSIYLCWKVAYVTYCVGFLVSFSTPDGVFRSFKTYAQTYIELKNNIENMNDDEVTAYLMLTKFDQLNPKAQQLLMQHVRQIRGTVIPYVL